MGKMWLLEEWDGDEHNTKNTLRISLLRAFAPSRLRVRPNTMKSVEGKNE
jgi:hypothetical protein